jgi:hypothetical protein
MHDVFRKIYLGAKCIMVFGSLLGATFWLLQYFFTGHAALLELLLLAAPPVVFGSFCLIIAALVEELLCRTRPEEGHSTN